MHTTQVLKFSVSNLLMVLTFSALWIALILPDHDSKIKIRAVKLQQELELIKRAKQFEAPISDEELKEAIRKTKIRRQAIAKR